MKELEKFMQIAFNLAKKHSGITGSNPSVGCVVVKNGKIISSAATAKFGRPHAENIALSKQINCEDAELYVTLEPCNHEGKTPPCVKSIIDAKIKKVIIGAKDTDERVNGSGFEALKKAGIEVIFGVLEKEIAEFYKPYIHAKSAKKPFVTAKIACSMDGKIATFNDISKWISSQKSRYFSNFLRCQYDGILIGKETFLKDNPALTCRIEGLEEFSPKKFIISNTLKSASEFTILRGEWSEILRDLHINHHVNHLLIEGGAAVISSAILAGIVDRIFIEHAPFFIGKDGKNCVDFAGISSLQKTHHFKIINHFQTGEGIFTILEK